jgi:hypothetical protein
MFDHITAAKQFQQTKRIKTLNPTSGTIGSPPHWFKLNINKLRVGSFANRYLSELAT